MTKEVTESREIPISLVGDRYLIFDINIVSYLREKYRICGTPIGTLPQIPQQNLFLGLPIQLMIEEVKILTDKRIAFIVDDSTCHEKNFGIYDEGRIRYIESIRSQSQKLSKLVQTIQRKRKEKVLSNMKVSTALSGPVNSEINDISEHAFPIREAVLNHEDETESISSDIHSKKTQIISPVDTYAITPTSSYISSSFQNSIPAATLNVPSSYALYKHLHDLSYFILPGLRFGCDYNVYPGDPLRFHSHFIAVGYEWEQDIPTFDIIGGGRLGTAVKKGFLIGGRKNNTDRVRTFTIEWGGM